MRLLFSDVKNFFNNELGRISLVMVIFFSAILILEVYEIREMSQIRNAVHYRYFNTVRTTEDIYGIKIDTYNGEVEKRISISK